MKMKPKELIIKWVETFNKGDAEKISEFSPCKDWEKKKKGEKKCQIEAEKL